MFTVKAEIESRNGYARTVALFETAEVRIRPSCEGGAPNPAPDWYLELRDSVGHIKNSLPIGRGLDHYCVAFVMNERGKTVDSVRAALDENGQYAVAA